MKINLFLTLMSTLIAILLGYFTYSVAQGKENDILCGVGSFVCFTATLIAIIGIQYKSGKLGTNARISASLYFITFLISHFCFAHFGVAMPHYVVTNGILLVIFLITHYELTKIRDI